MALKKEDFPTFNAAISLVDINLGIIFFPMDETKYIPDNAIDTSWGIPIWASLELDSSSATHSFYG